jgi:hypothetical protein
MSIRQAWWNLKAKFRHPTLAEDQVQRRKHATKLIAECNDLIRQHTYFRCLAEAEIEAINKFERKEPQNDTGIRVP